MKRQMLMYGMMVALIVCFNAIKTSTAYGTEYPWQKTYAKMLPTGNMEWTPDPYSFPGGKIIRYIDFEKGNDSNPGSKDKPWKHHPWDTGAEGLAKQMSGSATYVFKGGVVYRGSLLARESGVSGNIIHLCCEPGWGNGPAEIYGSSAITGGWKRCASAADAPGIPDTKDVWYNDVGKSFDTNPPAYQFSTMWQVAADGTASRMHLARDPNWSESDPNDPSKDWHNWKAFKGFMNGGSLQDPHWKGKSAKFFDGGVIYTQHASLMGTPHRIRISEFNPDNTSFKIYSPGGASYYRYGTRGKFVEIKTPVRYFIENVAAFLDAAGEYFYDAKGSHVGRVWVRLPTGVNPNTLRFEVGTRRFPIQIRDQSYITISGLTFRYNDDSDGKYGWPPQIGASPMVRIVGRSSHITVRNCRFIDVINAVVAFPRPDNRRGKDGSGGIWSKEIGVWENDVMTDITISDCEVRNSSGMGSISCTGTSEKQPGVGFGILKRVSVLRNHLVNTGFRPNSPVNPIPAISVVLAEGAHIAGNIVQRSWGSGIFTLNGKSSGGLNDVPFARILIHNNQCDDTMLGCNDYGGIELFQCGPAYIYNNISRNAVGNKTFTGRELAYNLYLDGGFKVYTFNNILAGRYGDANYYGHCGYFMVFGFMDQLFNNTITRFDYGLNGSSGNRSNVLGNIFNDCRKTFIGQNRPGDVSMMGGGDTGVAGASGIPTMSYSSNVFFGKLAGKGKKPGNFGVVGGTRKAGEKKAEVYSGTTLEELKSALENLGCRLADLGVHVGEPLLRDPAGSDYRPTALAKDRGVLYFVPWSLAGMVGEWNFYKSSKTPGLVLGENFYISEEMLERKMYYNVPRMDLTVQGASADDYITGPLENWIPGALRFDGKLRGVLTHAEMTKNVTYDYIIDAEKKKLRSVKEGEKGMSFNGTNRKSLDMAENNFTIEVAAQFSVPGGKLAGKQDKVTGYSLGVNKDGCAELTVGAKKFTGPVLPPKTWFHLLVEVDRKNGAVRFHLNGNTAAEQRLGIDPAVSIANTGDFVVGEGLVGAIDFLRVARSTLAESQTDIKELYAWQFDGPHFRDFLGQKITGKRYAGAIQGK
jgi:hypothetical protein